MKQNGNADVSPKSLKYLHIGIIVISIFSIALVLFAEDWGDYIVWVNIAVTLLCCDKFETEDELAKLNILKADRITMYVLFAAMILFAMYVKYRTLNSAMLIAVIAGSFVLRSVIFLLLDSTPKEAGES